MVDSFYTPQALAELLIEFIPEKGFKNIVDFCVGDGELLRAASKKWPSAKFYGTDISKKAIQSVRKNHPEWSISQCDFIDNNSRSKCNAIKSNPSGFDLILLNPPFTCKASTFHKVTLDKKEYNVSTAMKFIVESIKYLSASGVIYAIVPSSIIYSQKDKVILNQLEKEYKFKILDEPRKQFFQKCSPNIALISINSAYNLPLEINIKTLNVSSFVENVYRGSLPMNIARKSIHGNYYIIHTTNLKNNHVRGLEYKISDYSSIISGPAVLIPRVGHPNINKICSITSKEKYVLSDCVFAIKTKNESFTEKLKEMLIKDKTNFYNLYKGTGASYITIDRLKEYLGIPENTIHLMNSKSHHIPSKLCV